MKNYIFFFQKLDPVRNVQKSWEFGEKCECQCNVVKMGKKRNKLESDGRAK